MTSETFKKNPNFAGIAFIFKFLTEYKLSAYVKQRSNLGLMEIPFSFFNNIIKYFFSFKKINFL